MRYALLLAIALFFAQPARALVTPDCVTLYSNATTNASANGSILALARLGKAHKFIATCSPTSGTTPTLDIKIQECRAYDGTCYDTPIVFTQCTTGTCYGGDNYEPIEVNAQSLHFLGYVRAVVTLGGTSPVYNCLVEVCTVK